jgi:hypothetical protein
MSFLEMPLLKIILTISSNSVSLERFENYTYEWLYGCSGTREGIDKIPYAAAPLLLSPFSLSCCYMMDGVDYMCMPTDGVV